MANNNRDSDVVKGQAETPPAEDMNAPVMSTKNTEEPATTPSTASANPAPTLKRQPSNTLIPQSTSAGPSPRTSRNASPVRKDSRPQPLSSPSTTQPSAAAIQRALSAATPQLPAGGATDGVSRTPKAPKSAGGSGDTTPRWPTSPRLKSPPPSASNSRRGSSTTQKKAEGTAAPSINVQSATPQSSTPPPAKQGGDETAKVQQLQTPVKAPSRGPSGKSTLETVQENSTDDNREPSPAAIRAAADLRPLTRISDDESQPPRREAPAENEKHTQNGESGSESASTKSEKKKDQNANAQRPKNAPTKSYNPLSTTKSRQEGKQGMTVETETVQSIPQSALNAGDRSGTRNDNSGSVRLKPSNETIRPKKERKKTAQKARSLNQGTGTYHSRKSPLLTQQEYFECDATNGDEQAGVESSRSSSTARDAPSSESPGRIADRTRQSSHHLRHSIFSLPRTISNRYLRKASSKADIFEARVANAVDEANSSDSDETFVYESNPPDSQRRPARHHSRTPSVTSSHSVAEGQRSGGIRSFGDATEDRRVAEKKRSMKFSNNAYNDNDSPETKDGSVRSHTPRHFGRFGRGGSQASMFDPDSPFTQASKLRSNQLGTRNSRPNSPRSAHGTPQQQRGTSGLFGRKTMESSYDFDAEGGDENERTPLMGTIRTPRSGRLPRRINSTNTAHSIDEYYGVRRHSRCGKYGGCFLFLVVLAAVIMSAIAFLVMSNRPLYDVRICKIENVLASEQELMLDLVVGAVNPNALGITVDDMDVNLFARSKHVGSGKGDEEEMWQESVFRRKRRRSDLPPLNPPPGWQDYSSHWRSPSTSGGVDKGTDPPDDDDLEKDAQTMLLGRILHFDQGLSFEGSPLKRHTHSSVGELRLEKPGNKTETGGSERWERVLKYEFELIVMGVLKYQLPISSRVESAAVRSSIMVYPDDGEADPDFAKKWRFEASECEVEHDRGDVATWWRW